VKREKPPANLRSLLIRSLLIVLLPLGAYFVFYKPAQFPLLPDGKYVGVATGFGRVNQSETTFYAEKLAGEDKLLLLLFLDKFQPQIVQLELLQGMQNHTAIKPINLKIDDRIFLLSGSQVGEAYKGKVMLSGVEKGWWELKAIPANATEVMGAFMKDSPMSDFKAWLDSKLRLRTREDKLRQAKVRLVDQQEKVEKLQKTLAEKDTLLSRAQQRREELDKELLKAVSRKESLTKEIDDLISELDLLQRITKKGQAIRLARRIAHRENKWFLANWGSNLGEGEVVENTTSGAENMPSAAEQVGENPIDESALPPSIDAQKLTELLRKAEEIQSLLKEIEREKSRISQLNAQQNGSVPAENLYHPPSSVNPPTSPEQQPIIKDKAKSLWDEVFG
jgi:hypothetical protein